MTSTKAIKPLAEPRPKGVVIRDATQTESWMKGPSRPEARLQGGSPDPHNLTATWGQAFSLQPGFCPASGFALGMAMLMNCRRLGMHRQ
jgi:hypothetical protein